MNRKEWLEERKKGIGGSDIAALLGLDKYKTPLDVYNDKQPDAQEKEQTEDMLRGQMLEDFVAKMYGQLSGEKPRKSPYMIYTHPEYEFLKASPDRFYGPRKSPYILECKTIAKSVTHDDVPLRWICQLQHTMLCAGAEKGTIAWCSPPGFSIEWLEFDADPELHKMIIERASSFWAENVVAGVPPAAMTSGDVEMLFPVEFFGKEIEATEETLAHIVNYRELRAARKKIEDAMSELSDALKSYMLDAAVMKHGGRTLATFKARKPSISIDIPALQTKYPDVYKELHKITPGSRTLLVKDE